MADSTNSLERQRQWTVIAVIGLGMGVALADALSLPVFPYSPLELAVILTAGVVYLILSLQEDALLDNRPSNKKTTLYFAVQFSLVALILALFETANGIWLIPIPLVGTAVGRLPTWGQLVIGAIALATIAVPVGLRSGWQAALFISASVLPAFIFVALFVKLLISADDARGQAQSLAAKLETANAQLARYASQIEELAIKEERARLAREIHDSLGHYLTVINVQLEAAQVTLANDPARTLDAISKAQSLALEGLSSVRRSVAAFRTSPVDNQSLPAAVAELVEELRETGLVAELELRGPERILSSNNKLALYRIVQEGLTNVRKHARASRVNVTLAFDQPQEVLLSIRDNGIGAAIDQVEGFGLLGIQERVKLLDGRIEIETAAGQGFQMTVHIPG